MKRYLNPKERKRRRQNRIIIGLSILVVLLGAFAASVVYFERHYPFNTSLYGTDVSLEEKRPVLTKPMNETYRLIGPFSDSPLEFNLRDFGGEYEIQVRQFPEGLTWIRDSLTGLKLEGEVTERFDRQALSNWVQENLHRVQGDTAPRNATLTREGSEVRIEPEVPGNILADEEALVTAVLTMVDEARTELNVADFYTKAAITSADLEAEAAALNTYKIQIPELNKTISSDEISTMLDDNFQPVLTEVQSYVWGLANTHDTYDKVRNHTTILGDKVQLEPGIYGWRTDVDATVERLMALLKNREPGPLNIAYQSTARARGEDDIGPYYIEISLEKQHLWLVSNGEVLLDYAVVTGLPTPERETDKGVGEVWSKEYERLLVGEDYRIPVEYWMPFNWNHQGMHSASWFTAADMKDDTYTYSGSHGCVNMLREDVYELYQTVEVGTPVLIY